MRTASHVSTNTKAATLRANLSLVEQLDSSASARDSQQFIAKTGRARIGHPSSNYTHWRVTLCLPEGSTVDDALQAASADLPERDWATLPLGIHGRLCGRDQRLVEGDRVELYRPLVNDPKAARRARARRR